jgi:hypothetical protein
MTNFLDTVGKAAAAAAAAGTPDVVPRAEFGLQARASNTLGADAPIITTFFPQVIGEELVASVINVADEKTTLGMCIDGYCDMLVWTFVYGESTAAIEMTALDQVATIECAVTSSRDEAACTLTGIIDGETTVESLTIETLTDFVTTFPVTAGADLLTDAPAPTTTSRIKDDDDEFEFQSSSFVRTQTTSSRTRATPGNTNGVNDPEETGTTTVPDGEGAAPGLARPLVIIAGVVGAAVAFLL